MFASHPYHAAAKESSGPAAGPVRYPTNHVVGVLNTAEQAMTARTALTGSGFLESEVVVSCGQAAADAMDASTGRSGLTHLAARIAERFGVADEEMAIKDGYEEALRDGRFVVSVLAPTDERKHLASRLLRDNGGKFVNFLGRFSIEPMRR